MSVDVVQKYVKDDGFLLVKKDAILRATREKNLLRLLARLF
jgi:hypothetical protein